MEDPCYYAPPPPPSKKREHIALQVFDGQNIGKYVGYPHLV